ncbi:MAG: FecR family protein [Agriterribacter sp.]
METNQLQALIKKYNAGQCTPEEKLWLEQWYLSFEWSADEHLPDDLLSKLKEDTWKALQQSRSSTALTVMPPDQPGNTRRRNWWYYSAAAIVIVTGSLLFLQKQEKNVTSVDTVAKAKPVGDIMPGTSKASLVLDNGSVIALDSAAVTQLKEADGTIIDKQQGKIVYNNATGANSKVFYNTLNIPRGAEYQLVLPDGSKVWLNAASSLRFPTRFVESERKVYLDGEAYFEIAKNTKQPFKVITRSGMEVNVTGTQFNVMAYNDEAYIKTTLTEGKVKITNGIVSTALVPSQQAALQKSTQQLKVKEVDIDKEIAWKNGMIEFSDDDLPYIMRQLSRWYNVDVQFESTASQARYNGSIPRRATLSEVMQILKLAGVKYWLDNKRVVITGG